VEKPKKAYGYDEVKKMFGIGYKIKKKLMERERAKTIREGSLVGISPEKAGKYYDEKQKEAYINKQKVLREAQEVEFKEKVKAQAERRQRGILKPLAAQIKKNQARMSKTPNPWIDTPTKKGESSNARDLWT